MSLHIISRVKRLKRLQAERRSLQAGLELVTPRPYSVPEEFAEFALRCRIRSGKQLVPFQLYDYQVELAKLSDQYRGLVVYKTRQTGITETISCKFLHKACLNPAYAAVVLSLGQEESWNVSDRIKLMPRFPGFAWESESKKKLQPSSGGKIFFRPSNDNSGRSLESVSDILFDESAFVANINEIYSSATPSQEMVGDDARTWIVSTMSEEGKLGWFWQLFDADNGNVDAERIVARVREGWGDGFEYWIDKSGWVKAIVHWRAHPIYSLIPNYLAKTKQDKKLTEEKLQREYNLGLPTAGGSLFQDGMIDAYAIGAWASPRTGRYYLAGLDPNFGGSDNYELQIWDITERPYSLVAEYRDNRHSPTHHQNQSLALLDKYKPVLTAVETNAGGLVILENLSQQRPNYRFEAVKTSAATKIPNTDRIAFAQEHGDVIYPPDWAGLEEMRRFLAADRAAQQGHTDDAIMGWAAAWAWLEVALSLRVKRNYSVGGTMNSAADRLGL